MTTLNFPAHLLPAVQEKAAALTKLANRLGVEPPAVNIVRRYIARPEFYFLSEYLQERLSRNLMTWAEIPEVDHVEVEVTGTTPRLPGGWHLLASVEHTEAGNFVDCSPAGRDLGLGDLLRTAEPTCDHCGKVRQRRWTFVVADDNGKQARVGKGCLAGFLGFAGMPEDALFRFARELRESDDDSWGLSSAPRLETFLSIAALAFCAVREMGWVPGSDQYRTTTRSAVVASLSSRKEVDRLHPTEADFTDAREANEWLLSVTEADSDFLGNLATVARLGYVANDRMGLAVAVVPAYRRHQEQEVKRAERAARRTGTVVTGSAVVITGTVTRTEARYTDYGVRHVMTVADDRGFAVWGSIPSGIDGLRVGDRITFTATVEPSDDSTFGFVKRPRKASAHAPA